MDKIKNPFSPGAGTPPPELAGRERILEQGRVLFERVRLGRSEKSMLMSGLRGVGKTVLLNKLDALAVESSYRTVFIEATEDKKFLVLLIPKLRSLLYRLDTMAGAGDKVRRGIAVLKSFIGSVKMSVGDVEFGIDVDPEPGSADSGNLETDLAELLVAVSEAAQERNVGIAILVDEIQFLGSEEFAALIMSIHRIQQKQLPLLLVGAGLPFVPGLAGNAKSYAERLFCFPDIGPLSRTEAKRAIEEPITAAGENIDEAALDEIFRLTQGYPYFLQEWGYQAWNQAARSPIDLATVNSSTSIVIDRLDANFFRVRFDRLTPKEKVYLRAVAELGGGSCRSGAIAETLEVQLKQLGPVRDSLIKKGMLFSPSHGEIAFTVPLFDQFMRRAVPDLERWNSGD